jgi:pre-rRNA-processing protein IPI1
LCAHLHLCSGMLLPCIAHLILRQFIRFILLLASYHAYSRMLLSMLPHHHLNAHLTPLWWHSQELVGQLSHHNTHTRRDALAGLQQLLTVHPAEARRHAALLLEALATRVADGEQPVRTALRFLLRTAALPALGPAALAPFVPLFMAHLSAALTHLSADVRLDALAVLEALTEAAPQLMASDEQLCCSLGHYSGLLSRTNRGKSVKSQALAGLLKVLSSLQRFLQTALQAAAAARSSSSSAATATVARSAAAGASAVDAVQGSGSNSSSGVGPLLAARSAAAPPASMRLPAAQELLRLYPAGGSSSSITVQPQHPKQGPTAGTQQVAAATAAAAGCGPVAQLQSQSLQLLSVLFDCWSEAAPGSLSTAPEQEGAQVLVHILGCCQLLLTHVAPEISTAAAAGAEDVRPYGSSSSSSSSGSLCPGFNTVSQDKALWLNQAAAQVLPRLLKVFPAVAPAARLSGQLQDLLQRINLLGVQLLAGFMAGGVQWPPAAGAGGGGSSSRGGGSSSSSKAELAAQRDWQSRLLQFMAGER